MSTFRNLTNPRYPSAALTVLAVTLMAFSAIAAAAPVTWQSWSFDYDVSGDYDGLSLSNVTFQGRQLITKLSFPVMRVFYDDNACGPYADRLGGDLSPIPWASNSTLAQREFTLNGEQWYEIGIRDQIGSYDIYQVYYLSANGTIDAHVYSKGLQCVVNHIHYPDWRIDFDLDGSAGDQILRDAGAGFQVLTEEFDANATTALDHAWQVRDTTTGLAVDVLPGFPDFVIPNGSTVVPETVYNNNTVFGRVYRGSEDAGWTYGPNTQVPFGDNESITSANTVLWYEGYLPHSAADGPALWHSTGVRLVANLAGTPPPPPPVPVTGQTQSFTGGAVNILDNQSGAPYPSTVVVAGMEGTVSKVSARLAGLSHTFPDDLDIALVGPGGQAIKLMSDAGGGSDVNGISLNFDSTVAGVLPDGSQLYSGGVFRPTDYEAGSDSFPAPAPGAPYGTSLNAFNGLDPNGTWSLFVVDDGGADVGSLGSWVLTVITTSPADTTPDAFAFTDVADVALGTPQTSNVVTITGLDSPASISVTGGEYAIGCGVAFTTAAGTIGSGQTVCVRHTSGATHLATTLTVLTVGGVTGDFRSTTVGPPPDTDGDGVPDPSDNCNMTPNPTQCDSDVDGFGNECDADLNNDGTTNAQDFVLFRAQLGQSSAGPVYNEADLNCNDSVNAQDFVIFRGLLGLPPGPSGLVP